MENLRYTEILQLNKELAKENFYSEFSAKILSNVTVNSFKEIVECSLRLKKLNPVIEIGNFDNIVQDSISFSNNNLVFVLIIFFAINKSLSLFVLLNLKTLYEEQLMM